jgi:phosphatidylglycerophosphatase A
LAEDFSRSDREIAKSAILSMTKSPNRQINKSTNQQIKKSPTGAMDWISYLFATGAGAGLLPIAPGTFGALEGVGLFLLLRASWAPTEGRAVLLAVANTLIFALGVLASDRVCRILQSKDPRKIVIDEVSGQMISLSPLLVSPTWLSVFIGFILFRIFDIFKPYPIRKLEHLPGGLGVMVDDVLAGIYAAVLVWAGRRLRLI